MQIDDNSSHIETRNDLARSVVVSKAAMGMDKPRIQAARQKRKVHDILPDEVEEFDATVQNASKKLKVPVEAVMSCVTHVRIPTAATNFVFFPKINCDFIFRSIFKIEGKCFSFFRSTFFFHLFRSDFDLYKIKNFEQRGSKTFFSFLL